MRPALYGQRRAGVLRCATIFCQRCPGIESALAHPHLKTIGKLARWLLLPCNSSGPALVYAL